MLFTLFLVFNITAQENNKKKFKWVTNFFKYSTLYASHSENSPLFQPERYFVTQGGEVINVSPEVENDYIMNFGIRKIARYGL